MSGAQIRNLTALIIGTFVPFILHAEKKTIQRVDDPVVMECADLAPLFGTPIENLALMVLREDTLAPIPFQIDQKKPDGNYAFTDGPEASEDPDPNLDANDELVFMVKDTGDRTEEDRWPDGAETFMEIEVTDPKNGNKGWLYLIRFSGRAPRSEDDYIRMEINEEKGHRRLISYEQVGGAPLHNMGIDYVAPILPDGSVGPDILDMLKIRGELIFPLDITVGINADQMLKIEDRGITDGPVRVLHLAKGYLEYLGIKVDIKQGSGYSTVSYYVNHQSFPVTIDPPPEMPGWLRKLIPELRLRAFLDFNSNIYGSHPFSDANPYNKDVVLDGRMSEAEKNLDRQTPIDWIAGVGPYGAIVSRLILGPESEGLKKLTYYVDDETMKDPPENHPGLTGVGYNLQGITDNEGYNAGGTFISIIYYKSDLKPEEIWKILDIIDNPLEVKVSQVK